MAATRWSVDDAWSVGVGHRGERHIPVITEPDRSVAQRVPVLGHGGQHHVLVILEPLRGVVQRAPVLDHRSEYHVLGIPELLETSSRSIP